MSAPPDNINPTDVTMFPPSGFDRADGLTNNQGSTNLGTPVPAGVIFFQTPSGAFDFALDSQPDDPSSIYFLEEYPDSPEIERGEQATITHRFACDQNTANDLIGTYYRGVLMLDSSGNTSRVLTSKLNYKKGGYCDFTIVAEGTNFDPPPDEFSIETSELNPSLDKHPRYGILTYHQKALVKGYINTTNLDLQTSIISGLKNNTQLKSSASAVSASQELLLKYDKGIDSFYLPGFKITYSQYFWAPQYMDPGGRIEDPILSGNLPSYFWAVDQDPDDAPDPVTDSIFVLMALKSPQIYGGGISWLRQCDTQILQRTWWKVTETWIGGPLGHWDKELYTILVNAPTNVPPYSLPYSTDPNAQASYTL